MLHMRIKTPLLFILLICTSCLTAEESIVQVAEFSNNNINDWMKKEFDGITQYNLDRDERTTVLKAHSHRAASGLVKKIQIDLYQTPYINWRWKVNNPLFILNETEKEGDDYAARIYVVIDGGVLFWRTLALNYVWASNKAVNDLWTSPYTSNVKMIAIESGEPFKKQWRSEKRNVRTDLRKAFGREIRFIDAVAIMTDTDNSQQKATAYYGDIYFTSE